ncbi:MAG TPA: hypothetical protein VGJ13_03000 [Pseudonocardiaceae bacterium]
MTLLDPADRDRYFDLAIFPEDVDIPLDVQRLLWPTGLVDALCEELTGLGPVADYRLDSPGPRLVLHDVMRAYLRARRSSEDQADAHQRLTTAASGLLAPHDDQDSRSRPWWTLPSAAGDLWRRLPQHLAGAVEQDELAGLVCDLRWVEAKTWRLGSVVGAVAGLALVHTATADRLRWVLEQDADRTDATQPGPAGHTGVLTSCAFSPDGILLATSSDDGTARLWQVADGTERAVFTGHAGGVWDCAFSPDGSLLATVSDDRTVRLWNIPDGTLQRC